jgi:hypothetical protein
MLFLLNNRVFNLTGGIALTTAAGMPTSMATKFTLAEAVIAAQTAFLANPDLQVSDPTKAAALAFLIASRSQANAALFVVPERSKQPSHVNYRLATVGITTLGSLHGLQEQGRSNDDMVNASVWRAAA